MGLDMYLEKRTDVRQWGFQKDDEKFEVVVKKGGVTYPSIKTDRITNITEEIGYWRKANQIHRWFVQNVQDGVDDCGEYYVSKTDLQSLLDACLVVKLDHFQAEEVLPSASGFFFGDTDYDESYYDDIDHTIVILKEALEDDDASYYYSSSW